MHRHKPRPKCTILSYSGELRTVAQDIVSKNKSRYNLCQKDFMEITENHIIGRQHSFGVIFASQTELCNYQLHSLQLKFLTKLLHFKILLHANHFMKINIYKWLVPSSAKSLFSTTSLQITYLHLLSPCLALVFHAGGN